MRLEHGSFVWTNKISIERFPCSSTRRSRFSQIQKNHILLLKLLKCTLFYEERNNTTYHLSFMFLFLEIPECFVSARDFEFVF